MKEENKDLLVDAAGFLWLGLAMVGIGIYALCQTLDLYSVTFGILAIIVGCFIIWLIVQGIIDYWKK